MRDLNLAHLPGEWAEQAACARTDGDAWFPSKGEQGSRSTRTARAICKTCPVVAECLDWALDSDPTYGIWGGKSVKELRKIRENR